MKLRIQENKVTLRLVDSDLKELLEKKIISTHVNFPNRPLYAYLECMDVPEITGDFTEEGFQFFFPSDTLESWINSSKVGFKAQVGEYELVVEKDLPRRKA